MGWLQVVAILRCYGQTFHKRYVYIFLALSIAFFIFTSGNPAYFRDRVLYVSGTVFLVFSLPLKLLWANRKTGLAARLMLLTLVIFNAVMLLRFSTAWVQKLSGNIYDFSAVQAVYLGVFSFGVVLLSISAILFMSERTRNEMERMLNEDMLTGAKSRRFILEMLACEIERVRRSSVGLSIMMTDLDFFKQINDRHGHLVGDDVLRSFVNAVKGAIRRPSEIGRYGGEEFLIVLPDTDAEQALHVADRILEAVRREKPELPDFSVSIGVEEWGRCGAQSLTAFIQKSDAALYEAKQAGRNRAVLLG